DLVDRIMLVLSNEFVKCVQEYDRSVLIEVTKVVVLLFSIVPDYGIKLYSHDFSYACAGMSLDAGRTLTKSLNRFVLRCASFQFGAVASTCIVLSASSVTITNPVVVLLLVRRFTYLSFDVQCRKLKQMNASLSFARPGP